MTENEQLELEQYDEAGMPVAEERDPHWIDKLLVRKKRYGALAANVVTILVNDDRWSGVLAYDTFADQVVTTKLPPWGELAPPGLELGEWTDPDTVRLTCWLSSTWGLDVSASLAHDAVKVAALGHLVHPVRDWLRSLQWDGQERLDTWMIDCLGAPDSDYVRAVGSKFMLGAIARIMRPGCKVDTVPVLEGMQGIGKSTAIRDLVGEQWFIEFGGELNSRGVEQLRRKWVGELSELDSLARAELSKVKAFLTTRTDRYRPAYARTACDFPRQFVFVGTVNHDRYLKDETNRRFWPVPCGVVDLRRVRGEREQLWAEARLRYVAGEAWHVSGEELLRQFVAEQESRREEDPWTAPVARWLSPANPARARELRRYGVTTADALKDGLGIETGRHTRADEMRVASVIRRVGWTSVKREQRSGVRVRVYRPEAPEVGSGLEDAAEVVRHVNFGKHSGNLLSDQPTQPNVNVIINNRHEILETKGVGGTGWPGGPGGPGDERAGVAEEQEALFGDYLNEEGV